MSTPAARRNPRRSASRDATPVSRPPPSVGSRRSPRKKPLPNQNLPQINAQSSNAYGASGRANLSTSLQTGSDQANFAEFFEGQREDAVDRVESASETSGIEPNIPETIHETIEEAEEDDHYDGISLPSERVPMLPTPGEGSHLTFGQELHAAGRAQPQQPVHVNRVLPPVAEDQKSHSVMKGRLLSAIAIAILSMLLISLARPTGYLSEPLENLRGSLTPISSIKTYGDSAWNLASSWADNVRATSPGNLSEEGFKRLSRRMDGLEASVKAFIKNTQLHASSIQRLEDILPSAIVVNQKRDGTFEIPDNFWQALKSKIDENQLDNTWGAWYSRNQESLGRAFSTQIDQYLNHAIDTERVISRSHFTHLLEENLKRHADDVDRLTRAMSMKHDALKDEVLPSAIAAANRAVATQLSQLPSTQLRSLAESNLIQNANNALRKVNFFSANLGAVVDPALTSPTQRRRSPSLLTHFYKRAFNVRDSKPPFAALEPWQEAGDCWCAAPSAATATTGHAQLGILMPHAIYPTQVTVEHIPASGTLDISAAPKHMELWVSVADAAVREKLREHTGNLFRSERAAYDDDDDDNDDSSAATPPRPSSLDASYVQIARWMYDIHGANHVQTFAVDANLSQYRVGVKRAVVRSTGSWGAAYTCLYRVRMHGDVAGERLVPE